MTRYRNKRALFLFVAVILIFLLAEAFFVSSQQERLLASTSQYEAAMQLDLMADASYEAMLKSDFVTIRTFIERWGASHEDYHEIRAIAPNGFVIAEYQRPEKVRKPTFSLKKTVTLDQKELLRLELAGRSVAAEQIAGTLRNQLLAGAILFTALLGFVLWKILQATAILPLEDEISRRSRAEDDLQRSHDLLEATVQERTENLEAELAERKRVEKELVQREERIHLLLDSTAEGIYGIDTKGACTFCNPSALRMLGFGQESDVLGKDTHALFHHRRPDGSLYPVQDCRIYEAYHTGEGCHIEDEVFWRADGTSLPIEYWSYPIKDNAGVPLGAVVTFIDITDRKRLEAQLIQSQKMEAIGTLAGGVAHDFNNILTAIIGYGSILQRKMENSDPLKSSVSNILEAAQRAARLTRSLLAFSRKQVMIPQPVDLNAIVRRVQSLLSRIIGEDIEIAMDLCDEDLIVPADSGQIEQVLMNLATNARDAMPSGGLFTVSSEKTLFDQDAARVHELPAPGDYAVLAVSDSGSGMDERTQASIFEPFFTTKEVGRGTGLGMSIVYGIIKQHNGAISLYSEAGKGSTFKIYLPLLHQIPAAAETILPESLGTAGTETILLAEDDQSVLTLLRTVLEENGYHVLQATDGEKAVRVFTEHRDRIQLALLDTIMPKMNGKQVYDAIRAIKPGLRVLFMSGYTADVIGKQGLLAPGLDLLQKPMAPSDLLRRVRQALDA